MIPVSVPVLVPVLVLVLVLVSTRTDTLSAIVELSSIEVVLVGVPDVHPHSVASTVSFGMQNDATTAYLHRRGSPIVVLQIGAPFSPWVVTRVASSMVSVLVQPDTAVPVAEFLVASEPERAIHEDQQNQESSHQSDCSR